MTKPKQLPAHNPEPQQKKSTLPEAMEIEQHVLGAMLIENNSIIKIVQLLKPEVFHSPKHQTIFSAIMALYHRNEATIDTIVLWDELIRREAKDVDIPYLVELTMKVTSARNLEYHAKILLEKAALRKIILDATQVARAAYDPAAEPHTLGSTLQALGTHVINIYQPTKTRSMEQIAHEVTDELDQVFSGQKKMGMSFMFPDIDKVTGGADKGDLIILSAPEKAGKSTMNLQMFVRAAREQKRPGAIFSAEMHRKQLLYRHACIDEDIRWIDVKNNQCTPEEKKKLLERVEEMAELPLYVRDGSFSVLDVQAEAKRLIEEYGVEWLAVDYAQRITPIKHDKNVTREQEIAAISATCKNLAVDCNVPVILISALNEDGKTRESRSLQYDMDKQISLDNGEEKQAEETGKLKNGERCYPVNIKIRQRMGLSGAYGDCKLDYDILTGSYLDYLPPEVRALLGKQQEAF